MLAESTNSLRRDGHSSKLTLRVQAEANAASLFAAQRRDEAKKAAARAAVARGRAAIARSVAKGTILFDPAFSEPQWDDSSLGDSFDRRLLDSPDALKAFLSRRCKAERNAGRILAFAPNPEAQAGKRLRDRFMEVWKDPSLALKIGFHGTGQANVPGILAAGIRPGRGHRCFFGATISKAMGYCEWRPPPGPAEAAQLPFTGKIIVCAVLVPSETASGDLEAPAPSAARKPVPGSAFDSPAFVMPNEAGELPANVSSTLALPSAERHLPLAVLTVSTQQHRPTPGVKPLSAQARLELLRHVENSCANQLLAAEAKAAAAEEAATRAAVAAEKEAARLAVRTARGTGGVARDERLPSRPGMPREAPTAAPVPVPAAPRLSAAPRLDAARAEATPLDAFITSEPSAASENLPAATDGPRQASARVSERLRAARDALAAAEVEDAELFEREREQSATLAALERRRAVERLRALSHEQVKEAAVERARAWAASDLSESQAADGRALARERVRQAEGQRRLEATSAAAAATEAAAAALASAAKAKEQSKKARAKAVERIRASNAADEAERLAVSTAAHAGHDAGGGGGGHDIFWAERLTTARRDADQASKAKLAASKAKAAAKAAESEAARAARDLEHRAWEAVRALEAAETVAVAVSNAVLAVMSCFPKLADPAEARGRLTAALSEAQAAVYDAALEAAQAQVAADAAAAAVATAASAAKAEAVLERTAAKHAKGGRKRLVDWASATRERQAEAAQAAAATAATTREKEFAVLAAVAAEEVIEAMIAAHGQGGEDAARQCGRRRVEELAGDMEEARAAAAEEAGASHILSSHIRPAHSLPAVVELEEADLEAQAESD